MHCPSINQLIIQSPWKSEWRSVCLSHSVSGLVRHSVIQSLLLVILTHISEIDPYWTSRSTKMVLAIAKSKLLKGNCHPKDRFRSEFVYSRPPGWSFPWVMFRYLTVKFPNTLAASCKYIKCIVFMSFFTEQGTQRQ